jgi:hypothetical protein
MRIVRLLPAAIGNRTLKKSTSISAQPAPVDHRRAQCYEHGILLRPHGGCPGIAIGGAPLFKRRKTFVAGE